MRRISLPDLVIPDVWVGAIKDPINVDVYVRNRRNSRAGMRGKSISVTVDAGSIEEAFVRALMLLVGKVNVLISGQMVWPADEPLPPDPVLTPIPLKGLHPYRPSRKSRTKQPQGWEQLLLPWDDIVEIEDGTC